MARIALMAALLLAGCASSGPERVEVPVHQRVAPPDELLAPIPPPPAGTLVAPDAAGAVACLTDASRAPFVAYVEALRERVGKWEAWAR